MHIIPTVSSDEAAIALGIKPPTVRKLIHNGRLAATRFGRSWRVHTVSVNALLGTPLQSSIPVPPANSSPQANPFAASSPVPANPAPSPPSSLQGNPVQSPIFTADDDWLLTYAHELTRHADPRVALLAAKVVMLHRDLAGCQAVKLAPPPLREVTDAECAAIWGSSSGGSTLF